MQSDNSKIHTQFDFDFRIVKIVPDQFEKVLYLLFRNETQHIIKKVSLSESPEISDSIEIDIDEASDLTAAFAHNLVISKITDPSDLKNQEFFILNFDTKHVLNVFKSSRFEEFSEGKVYFRNSSQSRLSENISTIVSPNDAYLILNSNRIKEDEGLHQEIKQYFKSNLNIEVKAPIEYLEYNSTLIFGVQCGVEQVESRIILIDEHKRIIENWLIDSKVEKLPAETFFVYGNFLIFVSDNSRLNFYQLS